MLLQNIRDICKERNVPIISTQTEEFLRQHLETHKPKYCLEIGSAV
jgi:predicted O-methyltransferase YrrM